MQKWEYRVFASHLDPAELVVVLNQSGREGWELVALVPVTDYHPREVIDPTAQERAAILADLETEEGGEVVALEAFRYIFKRPLA